LNGIRELELQRSAQARGALRDVDGEVDDAPGFHRRAIAFGKRLFPGRERSGEHLGEGDRRHGESNLARRLSVKQGLESASEPRVCFQHVNDRGRVHQHERLIGQPGDV
jgi:hypothetical protein